MLKDSPQRLYSYDNLRVLIIILILLIHSVLPYASFTGINQENYILSNWLIKDPKNNSQLITVVAFFIDIFNMPLLFFISGFFAKYTVERKKTFYFIKNRLIRVLIPFVFSVTLYIPLAGYQAYLHNKNEGDYINFWLNEYFHNYWYAGTSWFLWLLVLFSLFYAAYIFFSRFFSENNVKPVVLNCKKIINIFTLSVFCYYIFITLNHTISPIWGPFWIQLNRVAFYAYSFYLGIKMSGFYLDYDLRNTINLFFNKYHYWMGLGAAILYLFLFYLIYFMMPFDANIIANSFNINFKTFLLEYPVLAKSLFIYNILYPIVSLVSCAFILSIAFKYLNFTNKITRMLSKDCYAISLLHLPILLFLQNRLISTELDIYFKVLISFLGTFFMSFILAHFLKKIKLINRVI